jgi:hypothetical protein
VLVHGQEIIFNFPILPMIQKTEDEKELATLDCPSSLSLQGDAPIDHLK